MAEHYVCKGSCESVSETPGVCGAETCEKKGTPRETCVCVDDSHGKDMEAKHKPEETKNA